jgi:hypothetical protein
MVEVGREMVFYSNRSYYKKIRVFIRSHSKKPLDKCISGLAHTHITQIH